MGQSACAIIETHSCLGTWDSFLSAYSMSKNKILIERAHKKGLSEAYFMVKIFGAELKRRNYGGEH